MAKATIKQNYLEGGMPFTVALPDVKNGIERQFRAFDDDGYLYFEGYFIDDKYSENQMLLLDFFEYNYGVTSLLVKDKESTKWIQELS